MMQGQVSILKWLVRSQKCPINEKVMWAASRKGQLDAIKYLRELDPPCPWSEDCFRHAMLAPNWEATCTWLKANSCPDDYAAVSAVCQHSDPKKVGKKLKFLRELDASCPWSGAVPEFCAAENDLELLKWARAETPPCPLTADALATAVYLQHDKILECMRSEGCPEDQTLLHAYAELGDLTELKRLTAGGSSYPLDTCTLASAVRGGHLEVVKWLLEHHCPVDSSSPALAAALGHLDILQHLHSLPQPPAWDPSSSTACKKWIETENLILGDSGRAKSLQLAKALAHSRYPPNEFVLNPLQAAIIGRQRHVVAWFLAHEPQSLMSAAVATAAAQAGWLDLLQQLAANHCQMDSDVCSAAAGQNRLDILEWACSKAVNLPVPAISKECRCGAGMLFLLSKGVPVEDDFIREVQTAQRIHCTFHGLIRWYRKRCAAVQINAIGRCDKAVLMGDLDSCLILKGLSCLPEELTNKIAVAADIGWQL